METMNSILLLSSVLLIPLIPAFIIYRFLPSKTVVKGPFKGLNINLTGAFSGYFLLVIIAIGLIEFSQTKEIENLKEALKKERGKYQQWTMKGQIDSPSPEETKIFIDEENISINSAGHFKAKMTIKSEDNNEFELPGVVCFYNKNKGYRIVDLNKKGNTEIDTISRNINIMEIVKLSLPGNSGQIAEHGTRNWND